MPVTRKRIYYETAGQGPAVLFIHPPGMGHITFRRQKEELSRSFKVIAMDLRGNGRSSLYNSRPLTMETIAEDIISVLDHARIKQAYICGYSNGGSMVLEAAINYPDRLKGVILLGGFPEVNSFLLRNEFKLGIWAAENKWMGLLAGVLAGAHEWKSLKNMWQLASYVKRTPPEVLEEYYRLGLEYKATDRLGKIQCPMLLVYGQRADYLHHYRKLFSRKMRAPLDMILVGNVAHQTPTRKGSAINKIVKDFIVKHEAAPALQ
jgi:pimeloyl-ACP methyl ester carboxylesterase